MMDRDLLAMRERQAIAHIAARTGLAPGAGPPAFVGRIFANPSVPTETGGFFAVHPVVILGAEGEGDPGAFSVDTSATVPVYVVGAHAPIAGDDLVCRLVGHRWVAEGRTATGPQVGTATLPGCLCTAIPTVLTMTSGNPTCSGGIFQSCTLAYVDTPPAYGSLALGPRTFLSTTSFADQEGVPFRYYFTCTGSDFALSRVYDDSTPGGPRLDSVRYSWSLGLAGNSCSPLLLADGRVFSGGDTSCRVTISE